MPFLGYRLDSVVSYILSKTATNTDTFFNLLHYSSLSWHLVPPSLPTLDDSSPVLESRLRAWMPAVPAFLGPIGRRLVYALWLYSRGRLVDAYVELTTAREQADPRDYELLLSIDLISIDIQLALCETEAAIRLIHSVHLSSRHSSIASSKRSLIAIYLSESLLTVDLPAIAFQILDGVDENARFPSAEYKELFSLLKHLSEARSEWVAGTVRQNLTYPSIPNIRCRNISRSMIWRIRRLAMTFATGRFALETAQRFVASVEGYDGDRLFSAYRRILQNYPLAIARAILMNLSADGAFGVTHQSISTHLLYNEIYRHPSKSIAYDCWNTCELSNGSTPTRDVESELNQLLDAATKQNGLLRDDYASVSSRVKILTDHVRDTDRLRFELLNPIRRLENDIGALVDRALTNDESITVREMRSSIDRLTEEILQDIEDALRRIRKPKPPGVL